MGKNDLWNGQQYRANSSPQEISATRIINSIQFNGSEYILDVGCGDGKITQRLSHLAPNGKVIGIDASNNMITEAKRATPTNDRLEFFEKDAGDFCFIEKFDYIFSFHTLHWVKDKVKVFRNIHDHLKDGGKFIFITSGRENLAIANVFTSKKWRSQINKHGRKFHSTDENTIKRMLQEAGLSVETIKAEYWSEFYSSKTDLTNWLMTWVPYAIGLNIENSMSFSDEIADNILIESNKGGVKDKIEFKTEMLFVETNKYESWPNKAP